MKKTYLIVFSLLFLSIVSAQDVKFNTTILDTNQAYLNPSVSIDQLNGLKHIFWSNGSNLIYSNSLDNFNQQQVLYTTRQQVGNIQTLVDSNHFYHVLFSAYNGSYGYYYYNSRDRQVIDVGVHYGEYRPSMAIAPNGTLYLALVDQGTDAEDVLILDSSDYRNFNIKRLDKQSYQTQPSIGVDSKGVVHLAWYDWRGGIIGGVGQYKVYYANSSTNFNEETVINVGNQSYNPILKIFNDDVYIAFKDSNFTDRGFDGGDIFIADKNSNWKKQLVTNNPMYSMQDRFLAFNIDSSGAKHVAWPEINYDSFNISIKYANSLDNFVSQNVQDISVEQGLGYVSLDTYNNIPFMIANIHSIADYFVSPPSPTLEKRCSDQIVWSVNYTTYTYTPTSKCYLVDINNRSNDKLTTSLNPCKLISVYNSTTRASTSKVSCVDGNFSIYSPPPAPCKENWQCSGFGTCNNLNQTRTCQDINRCGTVQSRPTLIQSCVPPPTSRYCTFSFSLGGFSVTCTDNTKYICTKV